MSLKDMLMSVDEDRAEGLVHLSVNILCEQISIHVVVHRFVDQVVTLLEDSAGVTTVKQFQSLKFEDMEWPPTGATAVKIFVRMAIKKVKGEKDAEKPAASTGAASAELK